MPEFNDREGVGADCDDDEVGWELWMLRLAVRDTTRDQLFLLQSRCRVLFALYIKIMLADVSF